MKRLLLTLVTLLTASMAMALPVTTAVVIGKTGKTSLSLELAVTPGTREHGLMERKSLAPNDGMLFVFPREERVWFWMKNTPLPLDMLFLDARGRIIHIARNTTPFSETPIDSTGPTRSVVELAGGAAEKRGIAVGDTLTYTLPEGLYVE